MTWVRLRALPVRDGGMLLFCFVLTLSVGCALTIMVSWQVFLIWTSQVGMDMGQCEGHVPLTVIQWVLTSPC